MADKRWVVTFQLKGGGSTSESVNAETEAQAIAAAKAQLKPEDRKGASVKRTTVNTWSGNDMKPKVTRDSKGHLHVFLPRGAVTDGVRRTLARGSAGRDAIGKPSLNERQKRELAELEEKAKGDFMTPSDIEVLKRLRKLKAAYGDAKAKDATYEVRHLNERQKRELAELEEKAKGDFMTPTDLEVLKRLRKLKKAYGDTKDTPYLEEQSIGRIKQLIASGVIKLIDGHIAVGNTVLLKQKGAQYRNTLIKIVDAGDCGCQHAKDASVSWIGRRVRSAWNNALTGKVLKDRDNGQSVFVKWDHDGSTGWYSRYDFTVT